MGSIDDIHKMFRQMNTDKGNIISNVVELVYFMRGSIQYKDMMNMSLIERQEVSTFIGKRLEVESKKLHPQY